MTDLPDGYELAPLDPADVAPEGHIDGDCQGTDDE